MGVPWEKLSHPAAMIISLIDNSLVIFSFSRENRACYTESRSGAYTKNDDDLSS